MKTEAAKKAQATIMWKGCWTRSMDLPWNRRAWWGIQPRYSAAGNARHADYDQDRKAVGRTRGQQDRGEDDVEDEKEDEGACRAAGEMDEQEHGT